MSELTPAPHGYPIKLVRDRTASGLDELADVVAVIQGLARTHGISFGELVELAREDKRGGFLDGVMMYGHHPEFDGNGS